MITVKLFAILKDRAGASELRLEPRCSTVAELLTAVADRYPSISDVLSGGGLIVAVNHEFSGNDTTVRDGDEVALMPPFSGGGESGGVIRVQREPFSIAAEISRLKRSSTSTGAVVTFLGTTRDISKGRTVSKLEFDYYPGMAENKLEEIRRRAISDFGVIDVTIIHRTGTIPVGEDIVLIAVAAGHRDEAFRACRFCIDELKRIAPIWKRETTPDGEVWVEEHP